MDSNLHNSGDEITAAGKGKSGATVADKGESGLTAAQAALLEHNVFIVWKPEYNLGIPIIDEQHRGIVTTINSFYYGMQNNYVKDMLEPIIDMIHDYTHIHFRIEEDFFDRCGFPNAEAHRMLHSELTVRLYEVGRKSMLDKDPFGFLRFLRKWWIDHICNKDLDFRDFLFESNS